jgi:hypothetical protein
VDAPEAGGLFERSFDVEGSVVELLAEVEITGATLHLRDIAIFPAGAERAGVGTPALIRVLRRELLPEVRSFGFDRLRITGTRLSGAGPRRKVDITIDLTESGQ